MILPTNLLKEMVDEITRFKRSNTMIITLYLKNKQDASFVIDDAHLTSISISQDTINNVTDKIVMNMDITTTQYQQLITKQNDLYADIIIEYADRVNFTVLLDEDPILLRYNVFLHNMTSLSETIGVNAFEKVDTTSTSETESSTRVSISVDLIDDTSYQMNKGSFVGTLQSCNISDAIKYIASSLKVKKLKMIEPDNTNTFQHIIIPPDKCKFHQLFDYLQSDHNYGIYAKGFRHYITDGMLLVYPPYDMKKKELPKLEVIRVSENTQMGSFNYHKVKDDIITIISNTAIMNKNLSNYTQENKGNTSIFLRSDGVIDAQVDKKKSFKFINTTASISNNIDGSIVKDSAVVSINEPTSNMFHKASNFCESETEVIAFGWPNARIGLLCPGMPCTFIFDEKDKVMKKDGLVEVINYSITKSSKFLFSCQASLIIRTSNKQEPYEV